MSIQRGNEKIKEIYFGSSKIKEVYYGSDLIYTAQQPLDSYYIGTDDNIVYFERPSTPIENFCGTNNTIMVGGITTLKSSIKELYFGISYLQTYYIGEYFLYEFNNLTTLNMIGLVNVEQIGALSFQYCLAINTIDLSGFSNLQLIEEDPFEGSGVRFLMLPDSLIEVFGRMGWYTPRLETIICTAYYPPVLEDVPFILGNESSLQIKVRSSSLYDYWSDTYWGYYQSQTSAI